MKEISPTAGFTSSANSSHSSNNNNNSSKKDSKLPTEFGSPPKRATDHSIISIISSPPSSNHSPMTSPKCMNSKPISLDTTPVTSPRNDASGQASKPFSTLVDASNLKTDILSKALTRIDVQDTSSDDSVEFVSSIGPGRLHPSTTVGPPSPKIDSGRKSLLLNLPKSSKLSNVSAYSSLSASPALSMTPSPNPNADSNNEEVDFNTIINTLKSIDQVNI